MNIDVLSISVPWENRFFLIFCEDLFRSTSYINFSLEACYMTISVTAFLICFHKFCFKKLVACLTSVKMLNGLLETPGFTYIHYDCMLFAHLTAAFGVQLFCSFTTNANKPDKLKQRKLKKKSMN